jgi:hypothetical protein
MRGFSRLLIFLAAFGIFLGAFPPKAAAQCGGGLMGLGGVNNLSGNPFQAEVKQTFLNHNSALVRTIASGPQTVARDTQGRLRIDKSLGKFKVQDPSGAETEEERHLITICDSVKGEWLSLDTMNKTATVQKLNLRRPPTEIPAGVGVSTFCSQQLNLGVHLPGSQTEDLGHRTIEGLDAQGVLTKRQMPSSFSNGTTTQVKETISESETWCSEELGAVILRLTGTEERGMTHTTAMVNIQHGEPDESLFQIPSGYRIVERVNTPGARTSFGTIGGVSIGSPAEQIVVTDKP